MSAVCRTGGSTLFQMRILITGTSGLIGAALAARLESRGHSVVHANRRPPLHSGVKEAVTVDFAQPPSSAWWAQHLQGVDVVVNAVGIFQESKNQTFAAVHTHAPLALFSAAVDAGVGLVIQLSALGADENATTRFHISKRAADYALRRLPVTSVIVQPSLVYEPEGASASLFNRLALLPMLALPAARAPVQPVHLQDVIDAMTHLIEHPPIASCTAHAVGPEAMTLKSYLLRLRQALGVARRPLVLDIPLAWATAGARALSAVMPRLARFANPDALSMLARGNTADPSGFAQQLGRTPTPVESFLRNDQRRPVREHAQLSNLLVAMRASVATVWIVTGLLSLGLYPVQQSLQLLSEFGLNGSLAWAALYLGAVLDLIFGFAVLFAPQRWVPAVCWGQILLIAAYTVLITWRIPHWWLHPFGPILKNLPMLVGIAMLATFARRP